MSTTVDQASPVRQTRPVRASGKTAPAGDPRGHLSFHGPDWKDIRQTARALGFSALEVSELERVYSDRSNGGT